MLRLAITLAAMLVAVNPVSAEEEQNLGRLFISGGIMCETRENVEAQIPMYGKQLVDGCIILRRQLAADVYLTDVYVYEGMAYAMARYELPFGPPGASPDQITWEIRYGFWGRPKPVDESKGPQAPEIDA